MTIEPDDPRLRIETLTWADVDPDRHPLDPDTVLDVVRAMAPAGGMILRWSGAQDSITTPEETLGAVAGALLDWRMFLEDLAELFTRHLPLPAEPRAASVAWEATTASLVATVAARSGADEHWYPVCALALKWLVLSAVLRAGEPSLSEPPGPSESLCRQV